jgi:DNA-binding XRE family transcriptional regulator
VSPAAIKEMRSRLGYTQASMAEALGVAKLTLSQYETGYRKPGPTILILLTVLDTLPKKRAHELTELFRKVALETGPERKRSKT